MEEQIQFKCQRDYKIGEMSGGFISSFVTIPTGPDQVPSGTPPFYFYHFC
jgi:hypothetical protein